VNATSTWQAQGHNYLGSAWYRKSFTLENKTDGRNYALFFGGVDGDAIVYVNGVEAGRRMLGANGAGWDADFMIDITPHVKAGKNLIAVQVTKRTSVAGIFKGVSLMQL
jgi:beta-galactosidase/beta-glucuronidase